jgi:hypothetical protein
MGWRGGKRRGLWVWVCVCVCVNGVGWVCWDEKGREGGLEELGDFLNGGLARRFVHKWGSRGVFYIDLVHITT